MIRAVLCALLMMAGVVAATPAIAHASLLTSYPVDSVLLQSAPSTIALTFNEPVSVVELQITDARGGRHALADAHLEANSVVATMPSGLPNGTDALSWRVVSADGHPVGGTILFSVGSITANVGAAPQEAAPGLQLSIWLVGVILLAAQFIGVGGSFFSGWIAPPGAMPPAGRQIVNTILAAGIVAAPLSLGLESLDVIGGGLDRFLDPAAWAAGLATSYAGTVMVSEIAFALALVAMLPPRTELDRALSGVGLLALGLALSLSGHASNAPPQAVSWAAVFLHGIGVAFWTGSLIPLGLLLWKRTPGARTALIRFSRSIPFAVAPLVFAGLLLTLVQFTAVADFWTTDYGRILAAKLTAVVALFALAIANRFWFTDRAVRGDRSGSAALRRSIGIEVGLVVLILGLVGLWRFTPPPRSVNAALAALSAPSFTHVMTTAAMASVTVTPGRAGPVQLTLSLTDVLLQPLVAKEVSVDLANPDAGIEPITRTAVRAADGSWYVDGLTLPTAGTWSIAVNALITDFSAAKLEGSLVIRR